MYTPIPRTAPGMVTGFRDPSQMASGRVIADVSNRMLFWEPNATPLCTLTAAIRAKRKVHQYRYDWFEQEPYPRESTVSAASVAGSATVVVSAGQGSRIAKHYVLKNLRTMEEILVTGISTDTLTVDRAIGGVNSADMAAGDTLLWLFTAYEDGSGAGTMKTVVDAGIYNFTQIIRTPFGFTGRQENTDYYAGSDVANTRRAMSIEHKKHIEFMMFFGQRHTRTGANGFVQSFSGGLEHFIQSNIWDLGGNPPTEDAAIEVMEYHMKYGEGGNLSRGGDATKMLFASPRWMTYINSWVKDRVQYRPVDKRIGLVAGYFDTAHGTIALMKAPMFVGALSEFAFLVDPNHIRYVYHQGRDTKLIDNIQANDVDGSEEEYRSDVGVEVGVEGAHAIWRGLPPS